MGHVSIMSTGGYARTDSSHKRKVLESAYEKVGITESPLISWEKDPKLRKVIHKGRSSSPTNISI